MNNFKFKKKYGQNFLKNETIIDKIVSTISPNENDLIIEIGPGSGAITKKLKNYNANIVAFEIDTETKQYLDYLEDEKTKIIYKDILSVDIANEIKDIDYKNLYFIGNLPYYITTPIIEKIINTNINFVSLTIMVQKEVADRFLAKPRTKEYGYMTVLLNYWFDIIKVVDVDKKNFIPVPNVDSTVIKLSKKETKTLNYDKFNKLLKDSFQFKRKTLGNNLKTYDRDKVLAILKKNGYSLQNRAEEIDLNTYIDLTENI